MPSNGQIISNFSFPTPAGIPPYLCWVHGPPSCHYQENYLPTTRKNLLFRSFINLRLCLTTKQPRGKISDLKYIANIYYDCFSLPVSFLPEAKPHRSISRLCPPPPPPPANHKFFGKMIIYYLFMSQRWPAVAGCDQLLPVVTSCCQVWPAVTSCD